MTPITRCYCFLIFSSFLMGKPLWSADKTFEPLKFLEKMADTSAIELFAQKDFNTIVLNNQNFSPIITEAGIIPAPEKISDIETYLEAIRAYLEDRPHPQGWCWFRYGNEASLKLKTPFLGRGQNGAVYEILNSDEGIAKVIKIPLPKMRYLQSIILEYDGYDFWSKIIQTMPFGIPQQFAFHPLGLYRIMAKNHGITLTKALLRFGILRIVDVKNARVSIHPQAADGSVWKEEIDKIANALMHMFALIAAYPDYCISLSPNNIHITFSNSSLTHIAAIDIVDIGPVPSKRQLYQSVHSLADYLPIAANRLEKYLQAREYAYDLDSLLQHQAMASN